MKHVPPPGGGLPNEPPFMADLRRIEANITRQVDRYVRWVRLLMLIIFGAAFAGQWLGFGTIAVLKWWLGLS